MNNDLIDKMKNLVLYICCLIVGIYFGNKVTMGYYPNLLFAGAKKKIASEDNEFSYASLPDEDARFVVKPNPDFLYATCFYNLQEGPMRLTGNLPDSTYWSVALYEPNTVNFYVKNDTQFTSNQLDLVISEKLLAGIEKERNIVSPSSKGLILFRILVTDDSPENLATYQAHQQSIQLAPYQ